MPNKNPSVLPEDIHLRVGQLESTVNNLADSQTRFTNQMSDFVKEVQAGFTATHNKIDTVVERIQAAGKTNWPALGVMFTIGIAVLGYYVSAQLNPQDTRLKTVESSISRINNILEDHNKLAIEFVASKVQWELWLDLWEKGLLNSPNKNSP